MQDHLETEYLEFPSSLTHLGSSTGCEGGGGISLRRRAAGRVCPPLLVFRALAILIAGSAGAVGCERSVSQSAPTRGAGAASSTKECGPEPCAEARAVATVPRGKAGLGPSAVDLAAASALGDVPAPAPRVAAGAGSSASAGGLVAPQAEVKVPSDMVLVPEGTFAMGANQEGELDERPAHTVTIGAFLLDLTEVTNEAYDACVRVKVCAPPGSLEGSPLTNGMPRVFRLPKHPVVAVSWDDARRYCEWRGRRLPREAEWERAARADDDRRYVWGNEEPEPKRHGAFGGRATTAPVGSFPEGRSAFGNLDLAGNVWEWMADDYDPFAYVRETAGSGVPGSCEEILAVQDELRKGGKQGFTGSNPIPTECEKVLRGGAYNYPVKGLRNSNRVHHPGRFRIAVAGFRCARDVATDAEDRSVAK